MMTTVVAFSRERGKRDVAVTLLPITAILAIPAIRNLYVGSPPFGIGLGAYDDSAAAFRRIESAVSDIIGFFPQMLIIASCIAMVLYFHALKSAG